MLAVFDPVLRQLPGHRPGCRPGRRVLVGTDAAGCTHQGAELAYQPGNTRPWQLADLELRHRRHARADDRIRGTKDTGLSNLPLHDFDQNRIWCALVSLACEPTAWLQTLA
jgi:Transposase DDE domain group 1